MICKDADAVHADEFANELLDAAINKVGIGIILTREGSAWNLNSKAIEDVF